MSLIARLDLGGESLRGLRRSFGVRLIPERQARAWPGLVSLRRFGDLGPEVVVVVLAQ